jgi:FkbH-like protein
VDLLTPPFESGTLLRNLRKQVRELRTRPQLREVRIAILGGATSQEVAGFLELFLLKQGLSPIFWHSEYGKYWEDAVLNTAEVAGFRPDLVYIHTGIRNLQGWPKPEDTQQHTDEWLESEVGRYAQIWDAVSAALPCTILQNNFELPDLRILGNLDSQNHAGAAQLVLRLNAAFGAEARKRPYLLIHDINYLAAQVGLGKWYDHSRWFSYKLPTSLEGSVASGFSLAAMVASRFGLAKKVLVLDLDNTLWGGVIGDDGVDRIVIGKETAQAEAFTAFQEYCLALKARGVVLAVSSKNNEEIALQGFEHPDAILRRQDISCFRANWEPKHENIRAIAEELNLGLDSFVFVDDNPAERALVAAQLPMVAVPEMGEDVAEFPRILDRHLYFEPVSISAEDLKRGDQYQANAERSKAQATFANYGEYLRSLEMRAEVDEFSPTYFDRITQLTNKTNQFNLTTRRYSLAEISAMAADPSYITLYVRLTDRFGDHGLISAAAARRKGDVLHIDLWLMSCRVLKRDVEALVLDELVSRAREMGVRSIVGYYLPTAKNSMVAGHYEGLGFSPLGANSEGSEWGLNVQGYQGKNRNIEKYEPARSSRSIAAGVS